MVWNLQGLLRVRLVWVQEGPGCQGYIGVHLFLSLLHLKSPEMDALSIFHKYTFVLVVSALFAGGLASKVSPVALVHADQVETQPVDILASKTPPEVLPVEISPEHCANAKRDTYQARAKETHDQETPSENTGTPKVEHVKTTKRTAKKAADFTESEEAWECWECIVQTHWLYTQEIMI